jgi:hypothetical protein
LMRKRILEIYFDFTKKFTIAKPMSSLFLLKIDVYS